MLLGGKVPAEATPAHKEPTNLVHGVDVLDNNPHLIALSEHGDSLAYVDPLHTLRVIDLVEHKQVLEVPLTDKAVELDWIGDNGLFLGTESEVGAYTKTLNLFTVNLDSGELRSIHSFVGVSAQSVFKAITYSQYTNDVYILIGNPAASAMYHFDTNGHMSPVYLGGRLVENAAVTQKTNVLFFQDKVQGVDNVLKYENGTISLVRSQSRLLRVLNDTLFLGVEDANGNIIRIDEYHDGNLSRFLVLDHPVPPDKLLINDDAHVLVVNGNSYQDVRTSKVTQLPQYTQLLVRGNAMFVFSPDGTTTVVT
jgi:hypothetical protein